MAWQDDLQPASYNDVPFGVDVGETIVGRNTGVHLFPLREDEPAYVEDLGLAPTPTRIVGYLIGDDVAVQQEAMMAAMREPGPGTLVHPMRGTLTGTVLRPGCRFLYRADQGRYIEFTFEFLEGSADPFPSVAADTQGLVGDLIASVKDGVLGDVASSIGSGIRQAQQAVREVQSVGQQALSIANSAVSFGGLAPGFSGSFARFSGVSGMLGQVSRVSATVGAVTSAPARVGSLITRVQSLAARL